ncbi:MAG: carboxymuconolactone decarboxylase family protein [Solirubrobacteraceae bacterium]
MTATFDRLDRLAPGFAELTVTGAFGGVVARPGLGLRDRELVTIAALCALGRDRQLGVHLDYALALGARREELTEVLVQMAVYAWWPAAVSGLDVLSGVLAGRRDGCYDLGDAVVTVISDGHADMPLATFAAGLDDEVSAAVELVYGPGERLFPVALNSLVIERDGMLIVVDPGAGLSDAPSSHGLVPPSEGHFLRSFAAAGFDANDVGLVLLSHGHHDHAGCLAASVAPFANARVAISETEFVHWRDHGDFGEAAVPDVVAAGCREIGREFTSAVADRVIWTHDGQLVAPGVRAIDAPGHTPGRTAFAVEGSHQTMLLGGDFAGHEEISLRYPNSHHAADYNPAQAIASRRRLLRHATETGALVHGFHFTRPGIGRIKAYGEGWRFRPVASDPSYGQPR